MAGISKHLTNRLPTSVSTYNGHSISVTTDPSYVRDDVDSFLPFLARYTYSRLRFTEGNSDISADWKSSLSISLWTPSGEIEVDRRAFGGKLPIRGFWYQLQEIMLCHFNEIFT